MRSILWMLLIWASLLLIFLPSITKAQADTVRPGKGHLMTNVLKPGLRQYLIYFQDPKKSDRLRFWFWLRDVRLENHNGTASFAITQHWYGSDSSWFRTVYSLNDQKDFAPMYHMEQVRGKTYAYNWNWDGIAGADTVDGNARKAFSLKFTDPNLNWNLDIETFEMLPLASGKSFLINFYDAGLDPPKYVLYKVTGSEEISLFGGVRADCWKLVNEGKSPDGSSYSETYWIDKKTHEFLKEEDSFSGMYRVKVKMPGSMPDLIKKFNS